jgi:hypothetical protein
VSIPIKGKGDEGDWATTWLDWLWRTHIEPRGFVVAARPSGRVLDITLVGDRKGFLARLRDAITAGPTTDEAAPKAPTRID